MPLNTSAHGTRLTLTFTAPFTPGLRMMFFPAAAARLRRATPTSTLCSLSVTGTVGSGRACWSCSSATFSWRSTARGLRSRVSREGEKPVELVAMVFHLSKNGSASSLRWAQPRAPTMNAAASRTTKARGTCLLMERIRILPYCSQVTDRRPSREFPCRSHRPAMPGRPCPALSTSPRIRSPQRFRPRGIQARPVWPARCCRWPRSP